MTFDPKNEGRPGPVPLAGEVALKCQNGRKPLRFTTAGASVVVPDDVREEVEAHAEEKGWHIQRLLRLHR